MTVSDKLRKLDAESTPVPWKDNLDGWIATDLSIVGKITNPKDRALVIALRNALPAIIRLVEDVEKNIEVNECVTSDDQTGMPDYSLNSLSEALKEVK
jgi:hypothetical protein